MEPEKREACWDVFDSLGVELLVPILYGVDLLGLIAVGRKSSGERLGADDRQLLRTLANNSAIAIENGCTMVTTDSDYDRFPGLRWQHPLRPQP